MRHDRFRCATADVPVGGDGEDVILDGAVLTVHDRTGPGDVWQAPEGTTTLYTNTLWGVYQAPGSPWGTVSGVGWLTGDTTADYIDGGDGTDNVVAGFGADLILGGLGNDTIAGAGGGDVLMGGEGEDTLFSDGLLHPGLLGSADPAAHGADFVDGGDGNDSIDGGGGADMLLGGAGNDLIRGDTRPESWNEDGSRYELPDNTIGDDYLDGEGGDDALIGRWLAKDTRMRGSSPLNCFKF